MLRRIILVLGVAGFVGLTGCGGDDGTSNGGEDTIGGDDTASGSDTVVDLLVPGGALGACAEKDGEGCHEFVGANYTEELASAACDGSDEIFQWGASCSKSGAVGTCLMAVMSEMSLLMVYYDYYDAAKTACGSLEGTWSDL